MNSYRRTMAWLVASSFCVAAATAGTASPAGKTRAQVRAELMAALDQGWHPPSGEAIGYPGPFRAGSERTRESVRASLDSALDRGVRLPRGEAPRPRALAPASSSLTRTDVRQALISSLEAGWHPSSGEADYWRQQSPGPMASAALGGREFAAR